MTLEERVSALEKVVALFLPWLKGDDRADAEALLCGGARCARPGCRQVWHPGVIRPPGEVTYLCPEHHEPPEIKAERTELRGDDGPVPI